MAKKEAISIFRTGITLSQAVCLLYKPPKPMNPDHERFLNLVRLPATINAEQAAILLGVAPVSIAVLVAKKYLKPLGRNLAANAVRRFASVVIEGLARDQEELDRMQRILSQHWRNRNGSKNSHSL